jgi:Zn finger protein HypA/HybF involved in hydrogenase expression
MHEVAIAQSLLRTAEAAARNAGLARVTKMQVELGARAALSPRALSFALDLSRPGTLAADAEIVYAGPGAENPEDTHPDHVDHDHHDHAGEIDADVRLAWIEGT